MQFYGIEIDNSIGLPLFFFAGLYIALSPCLFPVMPLTVFRIMNKSTQGENGQEIYATRPMILKWVSALTGGVLASFLTAMIVGAYIWSYLGLFLIQTYQPLTFILGVILVTMGLFLLFPILGEKTFARIPIPERIANLFDREEFNYLDLFIIGLGYSFVALPCAFPVFTILLSLIPTIGGSFAFLFGLLLFSGGLFLPYFALVLVTTEARTVVAQRFAERFRVIEIITALLVIIFGLLFILPTFTGKYIL
ncbi:MAG: hypothetical protein EAX86_04300 [Candidatus Heimdallarchaeota archaeon]|nr:hypothetical protein [Candidatus Heimdallarchaeota archaeon]